MDSAPKSLPSPTPYPDVNTALRGLHQGARAVLGERWVGTYVNGSLALGDFRPETSDVDFLVAVSGELPEDDVLALAAMHARLRARGGEWACRLEGSYIPLAALRRQDPAHAWPPALRADGTFAVDGHGPEWVIQRHILREHGRVVAGPPPGTLIDPVTTEDLKRAVRDNLREWWAPMVGDPSHLATPEYRAYAVLTMCRSLYTLETGAIATKPAAARWAASRLDATWAPLIEGAIAWRPGQPFDALPDVLSLIRFTLSRAGLPD